MPICDLYVNKVFWKKIQPRYIHDYIKIILFDNSFMVSHDTASYDVQKQLKSYCHEVQFNIKIIKKTILVNDGYDFIFYQGHCNDPCFYLDDHNELCYKKIIIPKVKKILTRYELMDFD